MRSPTLKDVAARVGVSPGTVAAALNGVRTGTRVSEATRKRIQDAATALGYVPNATARHLRQSRTNTIAVLFDFVRGTLAPITSAFACEFLDGVLWAGQEPSYDLLLFSKTWENFETSAAPFRSRRADGLIVVAPVLGGDTVSGLRGLGIRLSVAAGESGDPDIPWVGVDNTGGIREAVTYLVGLGHRSIGFVPGLATNNDAHARREAFLAAMEECGLDVPPEFCPMGFPDGDDVEVDMHRRDIPVLLSLPEPPTAVLTWNDTAALMVLSEARSLGIAVPGQLSVIGFDDIPAAEPVGLSTIRQPIFELGKLAAHNLFAQLENQPPAHHAVRLPVELVLRATTAPPS
jgi:LacI family transcriptional regulator